MSLTCAIYNCLPYLSMSSNQPIIIQQSQLPGPGKSNTQQLNQEQFFELLDKVEDYDSISTSIRQKYRQAMLRLASIKFSQPHALNLSAHRCVPALLKVDQKGSLTYEYSHFSKPASEEEVYPEQFQEQEQTQNECLQKQKKYDTLEGQAEGQQYVQNQLLRRFNVLNQQEKALKAASQFKEVIGLLMELEKCRRSFQSTIEKIEKQH